MSTIMCVIFFVPLAIIIFSNVKIWKTARESTETLRQARY